MNVYINVTFSGLYPDVQRHLSVIGKRTANKQGENMFSAITVSSAEKDIFALYMQQASQNVVAAIEEFVSEYVETSTSVSFFVTNTRWNDPNTPSFFNTFSKAFNSYLVNYTLYEYLSMTFPELAKKYYDAAVNFLTAIIRLIFFKAPPIHNGGVDPTVVFEFQKKAINIGTDADPYYAFTVPKSDFTDYDIKMAYATDLDETQAHYTVKDAGLVNTIVSEFTMPHTFSPQQINNIKNTSYEFVVFYPLEIISEYDTLTLTYTMKSPESLSSVTSTAIG